MCGIVGIARTNNGSTREDLMRPLSRLEYRGYDSCGFATTTGAGQKFVGKISEFMNGMDDTEFKTGIAHTRWATHGGKTVNNAHPHFNAAKTLSAVHNGIIENYSEMRAMLESFGYVFKTDTDTEVIPHYFDHYTGDAGLTILETIRRFYNDVRGTYAVLLIEQGTDTLYAFKKDSPLVLGVGEDYNIVASDIYAFSDRTTEVVFFEDYQAAVVNNACFQFYDVNNDKIHPDLSYVERQDEEAAHDYDHHMLKEINEQPRVAQRLISSLAGEQKDARCSFARHIENADEVFIVACGTSHHAGLIGRSLLLKGGKNVNSIIASEFDNINAVGSNSFVIAISQSGETMDVLTVLKQAKQRGAKIGAITNSTYSSIERLSDVSLNILAGQEVSVASTKAFTNQIMALLSIASRFTKVEELPHLPLLINDVIDINQDRVKKVAKEIALKDHVFFLGRRLSYPVAMEMALKLKEISYIHAEGQMAGELKHGSIALIDPDVQTPVFVIGRKNDEHMMSSLQEVSARGARTILVTDEGGDFTIPAKSNVEFVVGATIIGQLLAYYTALYLNRDIDMPRNLAKSVTVG